MRFMFDVTELAPGMGKSMGIYNYAVHLFHHLTPLLPPDWDMLVTCNQGCAGDFLSRDATARVQQHVVVNQLQPSTVVRQRWMRWGAQAFARKMGVDVYFTPKGFLPGWWGHPIGLKTVAVLHDLIPLWYETHAPHQFGWLERQVVNRGLLRAARWADELITISQATADEVNLRVHRNMPPRVVHNGIPLRPGCAMRPVSEPYLFAMASMLPHKNVGGVLAAYSRYRDLTVNPLPLVICGISDPGMPGVRAVRGLSDEVLHAYYAHAEAFLFLSLIEGFGFPPLEAMSHGTPVVCSDIAVFRELTRGVARLVPPTDSEQAARALIEATQAERGSPEQAKGRAAVAALYDWNGCARGVMSVLQGMKR